MRRETAINVLLIIAGIVLAIALFGAGVLWRRGAEKRPKALSPAHVVFRSFRTVGNPYLTRLGTIARHPGCE
jgi:hypothetical protein